MLVTLLPIVTLVRLEQESNALNPMVVTHYRERRLDRFGVW